jgi:hypothetical protein
MVGVPVRIHDLDANDLGIAHLPLPLELGDLVVLDHSQHRVYDVVMSPPDSRIAALVKVRPAHLVIPAK